MSGRIIQVPGAQKHGKKGRGRRNEALKTKTTQSSPYGLDATNPASLIIFGLHVSLADQLCVQSYGHAWPASNMNFSALPSSSDDLPNKRYQAG